MSILKKIFGGGGGNPMTEASKYLNQIPGVGHNAYDTYVEQGRTSGGKLQDEYDKLISDPVAFINSLMQGYQPSEGYNFQKDLLTKEMSNTAAAGGIAGTNFDQMQQGQGVQKLLSQDMQEFLKNALSVYNTGLGGEENITSRGYDAAKQLADLLGGSLNQQGGLAFQQSQQRHADRNSRINAIVKALGAAAGAFGG